MMAQPLKPFEQLAFEHLPNEPAKPHPFLAYKPKQVRLKSSSFGPHLVSYRELGSGPPLLLIHGLMTSSYSWRYVVDDLAKHYTIYAPDLPGAGDTSAGAAYSKPEAFTPEHLAVWIINLVNALEIRGCAAAGNSLGGYLCLLAALQDEEVFSALVNIHSPAAPEARLYLLHYLLKFPSIKQMLALYILRNPELWAHKQVHYRDEALKSKEEARIYGAPLSSFQGALAFTQYLGQTLSPHAFSRFLKSLKRRRDAGLSFPMPLLLLYADQDPLVNPRNGQLLSELIPGAEHRVLAEGSHFLHVDKPQATAEQLLSFFAKNG